MSHIEDRWHARRDGKKVRTDRYGKGLRWKVRYEVDGRPRSKSYRRQVDAEAFLKTVEADLLRGTYVDPNAGRVTLRTFIQGWLRDQTTDPLTQAAVEMRLRLHVLPELGDRELRLLKPSTVQAWVRGLAGQVSANYARVIFAHLSAVLSAAVDDGLIARNPCQAGSVKAPPPDRPGVRPWPTERVEAVRAAAPEAYRATVDAAAGLGLRQGEVFGLALDDVDFLRRVVHVRRQVKIVNARLVFAPPKGGKEREVPLAESISLRLAAHVKANSPRDITLPWRSPSGEKRTARLVFTAPMGGALNRNTYNRYVWRKALEAAGVKAARENGMHALRHWYASVQLDGGTSIRALADYLGHSDPGFTLRTYTHLMPASEDRARKAVDHALFGETADVPATSQRGG